MIRRINVKAVTENGSPRAKRHLLYLNLKQTKKQSRLLASTSSDSSRAAVKHEYGALLYFPGLPFVSDAGRCCCLSWKVWDVKVYRGSSQVNAQHVSRWRTHRVLLLLVNRSRINNIILKVKRHCYDRKAISHPYFSITDPRWVTQIHLLINRQTHSASLRPSGTNTTRTGRLILTKRKVRKGWKQSLECCFFFFLLFLKETLKNRDLEQWKSSGETGVSDHYNRNYKHSPAKTARATTRLGQRQSAQSLGMLPTLCTLDTALIQPDFPNNTSFNLHVENNKLHSRISALFRLFSGLFLVLHHVL